jgi:hypothetical protein
MFHRSTIAKGALTAVAGVMALTGAMSVPTFAAAQSYGYGQQGYYDPCRRDSTNRSTAGALIGGALGAVIGSNAAARNARTEGALLGGALGAATGAAVGNRSAACNSAYSPPRTSYYQGSPYNDGRYNDGRYYDGRYSSSTYYDDYDRHHSYNVTERPGADGCTLAESPIYLPDGRTQKRFVRVCQDASGRYQVVD